MDFLAEDERRNRIKRSLHMKLKDTFITMETGGKQIMVSTNTKVFSGMVRSNATAGFIVDCLKKETTEDEIVEKMLQKYDAEEAVIRADVKKVLEKLRGIGALDE